MDKKTNSTIRNYISTIAKQNPNFIKAYLFGSYAKKKERWESDIDIAIIIDKLKDDEVFDYQIKLMVIAAKFDTRIEPHPILKEDFDMNGPFSYEIKKTGVEIKI